MGNTLEQQILSVLQNSENQSSYDNSDGVHASTQGSAFDLSRDEVLFGDIYNNTSNDVFNSQDQSTTSSGHGIQLTSGIITTRSQKGYDHERKERLAWPKANDKSAWMQLDEDLEQILKVNLLGPAHEKMTTMTKLVYNICKDRFGTLSTKKLCLGTPKAS